MRIQWNLVKPYLTGMQRNCVLSGTTAYTKVKNLHLLASKTGHLSQENQKTLLFGGNWSPEVHHSRLPLRRPRSNNCRFKAIQVDGQFVHQAFLFRKHSHHFERSSCFSYRRTRHILQFSAVVVLPLVACAR